MNYKNNMDRYYMQAHYNRVRNREKNRNIILWLLSLIGIFLLGLFFLYKTYSNAQVEKLQIEKLNVSESATVTSDNLERKSVSEQALSSKALKEKSAQQEKVVSRERNIPATAQKVEEPVSHNIANSSSIAPSKENLTKKSDVKVENRGVTPSIENVKRIPIAEIQAKAQATLVEAKNSIDAKIEAIKKSGEEARLATKSTGIEVNKRLAALATDKNLTATLKTNSVEVNESNKNTLLDKKSVIALEKTTTETNVTIATTAKIDPNEPLYHIYIISKGETISSIALKEYNDSSMYQRIIDANPSLKNPNSIREGDEILLPIVDEKKEYSDILHFK